MSISQALSNAVSGLTVNGRQLGIASDNIANALTKGYAARSVSLTSRGDATGGVRIASIDRAADTELTALRREADGAAAGAGIRLGALERFTRVYGELGQESGVFNRLVAFEQALASLADTPEAAPRQEAAVRAAQGLVGSLNGSSETISDVRSNADAEIARTVDRINAATERIAALNAQVRRLAPTGADTSALADERERLIDEVAAAIPIRLDQRDDGTVSLRTDTGLVLVGATANPVEFTPSPIVTPEMAYSNGTGALSGITLSDVDITPGGDGTQRISGGGLASLFAIRDSDAPEWQARLDALAAELITRFSASGLDPTLAPGAPGIFTDNGAVLGLPSAPGLAGRLDVNAALLPGSGNPALLRDGLGAISPGAPANDTLPRALIGALTEPAAFPYVAAESPLSLRDRVAATSEAFSTLRAKAVQEATRTSGMRETLAFEEGRERAVDTDTELQELIRIEQAYAANAQVIQVASRMLETLTGALR